MKTLSLVGYLLEIALSVGFVSCSKDDDDGGFKGTKKLVAVTYDDGSYYKFKYDSQGRVIEFSSLNPGNKKCTFEYFPDKIVLKRMGDTYTYKLKDGVIVSSYHMDDESSRIYSEEVYSYNKDKQLIRIQETEDGRFYSDKTFTWAGGNITMEYVEHIQGNYFMKFSYSDRPSRFIGIQYDDMKEEILLHSGYWGKIPKNLVSIREGSDLFYMGNYIYEFDSEGYVTKVIIRGSDGYTCTLTYED
jgi:hypothetical protein